MKIDAIDVWENVQTIGLVALMLLLAAAEAMITNALILVLLALVMKGIILLSFPWLGSVLPLQLFVAIAALAAFLGSPHYDPENPPKA